jgi:hypothetical protein
MTKWGLPLAFLEAALASDTDECILWPYAMGGRSPRPQMVIDGKRVYVGREVCRRKFGDPPTPDHEAAHSCGKGHLACINWRHVRWATHAENGLDMAQHETQRKKLTPADVRAIRASKETHAALARRYDVDPSAIASVRHRRNWRHV